MPGLMLLAVLIVAIPTPVTAAGADFYAAPGGKPTGDGSQGNPWDLATALNQPAPLQAGDTLWLRGGTYRGIFTSRLSGTAAQPVVVRSYPGEWAVIETQAPVSVGDSFVVNGDWTHYRDFELTNAPAMGGGFQLKGGQHNKFINLIIHDLGNNTFGGANEIYGSILYNNGLDGSNLQHHLYTQNWDPTQPSRVVDSIIFNSFAYGMHAYAGGVGQLRGIHMIGSVWFKNGAAQSVGERKDDILVGGVNGSENILLQENMTWAASPSTRSVSLGRYSDLNQDLSLIDNYLAGSTRLYNSWQSVTMQGNTFYQMSSGSGTNFDPLAFANNSYLTSRPAGSKIFVRPNQYQPGRAHIVIYNWDLADTVSVDASSILSPGDEYEVRNAQNYFGPPVASGSYDGSAISLPTAGLAPAQPLGSGAITPAEYTGKEFNVFVLVRTSSGSPSEFVYLPLILK